MNKKIKILLVCADAEHPSYGGISRWAKTILDWHHGLGEKAEIELAHCGNPRFVFELPTNGFFRRICVGIANILRHYNAYKQCLNATQYNIVHIVSSAGFGLLRDLLFIREAHKRGISSLVHFHGGKIPQVAQKNNWEWKLIKRVTVTADQIIVINKESYDTLHNKGYTNISFLPNPLGVETEEIIRSNSNIPREEKLVVYSGWGVQTKGVFELIDACKTLKNVKLRMIGRITPKMKQILYERAGTDCDSWLEIAGVVDYQTSIKDMLRCSVFVLPSHFETFSLVIIESMACGCPVVTTPVGCVPDIVNFDQTTPCCLCVEPKNVDHLRTAIQTMLNNRDFAHKCGQNAQKRVTQLYSMPTIWNMLVDIWKGTIN